MTITETDDGFPGYSRFRNSEGNPFREPSKEGMKMVNSSRKAIAILATLCLMIGLIGYIPDQHYV